jgi:Ankyrin repeats (3 copies)/Glutaminase/EF-hand domain
MAETVTEARRPHSTAGTDAIYRSLFDSFNLDKDGRISPLEVLSRLERSGLQPDDPRIAEALAGLNAADGGSRQISFTQFKALARHNSSLIRRALVIPGLMGIAVWSPRLDEHGNSVRGIEFCRQLVAEYAVHVFDSLHAGRGRTAKRDPRRKKNQTEIERVVALTWAASQGDLDEVRALIAAGVEPGTGDYDGRTPLHLAAAEGQAEVVRYLLAAGVGPRPVDRWGGTPLSDAKAGGHTEIAALLRERPKTTPSFPIAQTSERHERYERRRRSRRQGGRGPAGRRLAPDRAGFVPGRPAELRSGSRSWHARLPLRGGRRRPPVSPHGAGRPAGQHHRGPAGQLRRAAHRRRGPGPGRARRSAGRSRRAVASWCGPLISTGIKGTAR